MLTKASLAGAFALCCAVAIAAAAQPATDGGLIVNSGSTNARGYTLRVWSDGNTAAVVHPESAMRMKVAVGTELTKKFLADAAAAKGSSDPGATTCMKSASFGYILKVQYHGWTSADLSCPVTSPQLAALKDDVSKIIDAAKLPNLSPRAIPMPNDIRRTPTSPVPVRTMGTMPPASLNPSSSPHP